jgi:uncharacterized protein DUF1493
MNMELLNEVIAFVAEYCEEPKSRLTADTSINNDLGMAGDDGLEFMQAFSQRFAVDLRTFPHDKYFGVEAAATPISIIAAMIRWLTMGKSSKLSPLTLRQLAEAVENGRWGTILAIEKPGNSWV